MYRLYGFYTQNSLKALYVLEELGVEYEFRFVDLSKREQRDEAFLKMNPVGRVPVLEHNERALFESGAICRYVANREESDLYPSEPFERALVDQWLDFFTCHLGRWMTKIYYETVIRAKFNLGDKDEKGVEEALKFAAQNLRMLNKHLATTSWLANDRLSVADLFAYAYVEQHRSYDLSLDDYPNVAEWFARVDERDSITGARARLPQ